MRFFLFALLTVSVLSVALPVSAHEAYVLDRTEFNQGMADVHVPLLQSVTKPENLKLFLLVGLGVILGLLANLYFRRSRAGQWFNAWMESFKAWGPVIVRLAIGLSFFFAAWHMDFLGPDRKSTRLNSSH